MIKFVVRFFKKIIMAFIILYGLNVMFSGFNFYIPLNIITIGAVSLLGAPGVLGLVAMFFILK